MHYLFNNDFCSITLVEVGPMPYLGILIFLLWSFMYAKLILFHVVQRIDLLLSVNINVMLS